MSTASGVLALTLCSYALVIAVASAEESADVLPDLPAGKVWTKVWNDEFDGKDIDAAKWNRLGDKPRKDGLWLQRNAYTNGQGSLVLRTEKLNDIAMYASGGVSTKEKFEKKFGYFVIRCRLPQSQGHWPAFWLMTKGVTQVGQDGRDGTEVDVFEAPWLTDKINFALHWDGYGDDKQKAKTVVDVPGVRQGFHTFGMWWTPDRYRFYVDGQLKWETSAGGVSQVPQHLMITEEIGAFARKGSGPIEQAKLPDYFEVDYVRIYDETAD